MALSLFCACGARFEVEDTFAGQEIRCLECQNPLKAPALQRGPVRTSGYALASIVLALTGAFTVIGSAVAVVLGVVALISIARNRDQVTGAGYAIFGIVAGTLFTGLTLLALIKIEILGVQDWMHKQAMLDLIDYSGPLEIIRRSDNFAILRPSDKWGVVVPQQVDEPQISELEKDALLMLVHGSKFAYVDVTMKEVGNLSLDECRRRLLAYYEGKSGDRIFPGNDGLLRFSQYKLRESQRLPAQGNADVEEVLLDARFGDKRLTFLIRLCKKRGDTTLYIVRGWTLRRSYGAMKADLIQALNSFRLLGP